MDIHEARWLTSLFNHTAPDCTVRMDKVTISMETASGTTVSANARTPYEIGAYLKYFRDTEEPLFKRGDHKLIVEGLPNPIIFEVLGTFIDPQTRLTWKEEQLVRFRFFDRKSPSELCLHGDFTREDRINPQNKRAGPSLDQAVTLMFLAGHNWTKINFLPDRRQTLKLAHG